MKTLLVDDHDLVLKGMSAVFRENFPEMTVATASSGQKAMEEIRKADTDLTVLDLELPDISGFSLIRMIRQEAPAIKIIVNTVHEEIWTIRQLRQCNVDGVVFKSIDSSALVRTVREVIGGARPGFNADTKESVLSPKELEILQLLAKGMNSKDIAEAMFITVNTVESHRSHIMRKLGAANAADMVMKAVTLGLMPPTRLQ